MIRNVCRRLERLEARAAAAARDYSFSYRILLVDPEEGCTGVLLLESGKPTTNVAPTPEDKERVRADLERHRALSKKATDLSITPVTRQVACLQAFRAWFNTYPLRDRDAA